jgi:hypothetical protein
LHGSAALLSSKYDYVTIIPINPRKKRKRAETGEERERGKRKKKEQKKGVKDLRLEGRHLGLEFIHGARGRRQALMGKDY